MPRSSFTMLMVAQYEHVKRRRKQQYIRQLLTLIRIRATLRERHYLTSQALLTPEEGAWYVLYQHGTDKNLINQVGLGRDAFNDLLATFSRHYSIKSGPGRPGRPARLRDKHAVLGFILTYYCSTVELKNLCVQFGVPPSTAARTLQKAEAAMEKALKDVPDARIRWPTFQEQQEWAMWVAVREPRVTKKFAFIDGKNYKVLAPTSVDEQNTMYNGWLHATLVTGTFCFGADGCIIWGKHNCPGSWNDGETSRQFREKLLDENKTLQDYGVLSDSAFPVSGAMYNRIVTPLKNGDLERALRRGGVAESTLIAINNAVTSIRQAAEWGMGAVEKPFRRLLLPLPFERFVRQRRLGNIHRLYNFRVRRTNISQIRNVFSLKLYYE